MNHSNYFSLRHVGGLAVAALMVSPLAAQETGGQTDIDSLRLQMEQMQAETEARQAAYLAQMQQLQAQLDRLERERFEETELAEAEEAATVPGGRWRPMDGLRLGGGGRDFLSFSLIGTLSAGTSTERDIEALQGGGHDPSRRGFNVQGIELALDGVVDPYFRAQANLVFTPDREEHGDTVELEEAFLETLALPWNLQVRGGQFFTEFGRHNTQHLHQWKFVDQPLINNRMFGPDGLRNPGARVSWLIPAPFYAEAFFTVQDSAGETAYSFRNEHGFNDGDAFFRGEELDHDRADEIRNLTDLLYSTRLAASYDLSETQTILGGVSAAFGPNAPTEDSASGRTEIYGADFYWLWAPGRLEGYPFVGWQTEVMWRRLEMRNPTNVFEDYGFYTQAIYGFSPGWVAGLRYDWVRGAMDDAVDEGGESLNLVDRWRLSPNLTFHPSEFSKVRLQYNYDDRSGIGDDHSVWLQWEFALGPHGAHPF